MPIRQAIKKWLTLWWPWQDTCTPEDKHYEVSEPATSANIWDPFVYSMSENFFQYIRKIATSCTFHCREVSMFGRPLWVMDATCSILGNIILTHILAITQKIAIYEWVPRQERVLQQFQAVVQVALPFGPYKLSELMVFKGMSSGKICCFPGTLEQCHSIYIGELYTFWKPFPVILLSPSGAGAIVQLELPVMIWFLPDLLRHKVM